MTDTVGSESTESSGFEKTASEQPFPDLPAATAEAESVTGATIEPEDDHEASQPAEESEPYLADLVRLLKAAGALQNSDYIYPATEEGVPLEYADVALIRDLYPSLTQTLDELEDNTLFSYQGQALTQSLAGSHVVLEGGWSSDETLTYALPLAESLLKNSGGHALVLCPTQARALRTSAHLDNLFSASGLLVQAWTDDSQPPDLGHTEEASSIVLATTPEALNWLLATDGEEPRSFLQGLRYVVIDQAQEYQGYFGANVAVLLRRFAHLLAFIDANPQFFLVANGCANGVELAETLTGKSFQSVATPTGPAPKRHYLFVNPREADLPGWADLSDRVSRAALACVQAGKSVTVFCASEKLSRQCHAASLALGEERDADRESFLLDWDGILDSSAFPGAGDRDANSGRAVFTASLPDTIGGLGDFDGAILAGFPETLRSAMTLLKGRSLRTEGENFILYYSSTSSSDTLYVHNLAALLAKDLDQIVIEADSQAIMRSHLPSLAQESDGRIFSFSRDVLGNALFQALRREATELAASEEEFPQGNIDWRSDTEQYWTLWCEGESVGSLSPYRKFREAYPGAVLNIGNEKYRTVNPDYGTEPGAPPRLYLETSEGLANLRTEPDFATDLAIQDESLCLSPATGVSLNLGRVTVEERLTQISAMDESTITTPGADPSAELGGEGQTGLHVTYAPEEEVSWQSTSPAFWIDLAGLTPGNAASQDSGQADNIGVAESVSALAQMFRLGVRFTFPVGEYDVVTYSDGTRVFLVEVSPAAHGVVKRAFDRWRDILEFGANLARKCDCDRGCYRCLATRSTGAASLDKLAGLALAARLLEVTRAS